MPLLPSRMVRKRDSIIPVRKLSRHGIIVYLLTDAKQISTASDQGSQASLAERPQSPFLQNQLRKRHRDFR